MKIVYNKWIPFKGFLAINLFGVLFVRQDSNGNNYTLSRRVLNHEEIHTAQMKELGYIFFYLFYFIEWIIRLIISPKTAYRSISFEQEAYDNEKKYTYLDKRKHYAWLKYLKRNAE